MGRITWRSEHPLDLEAATARFRRWGPDPVNLVENGAYLRVAPGPEGPFPYRARQLPGGTVEVEAPDGTERAALEDLRYRLAEHLPVEPLRDLAARDRVVEELRARFPGYRPPLVPDPFETLVTAVCAQQINLSWATVLRARLVEHYGRPHRWQGLTVWQFPEPGRLASVDPAELRRLQFSGAKARYLVGLAEAACSGFLDRLQDHTDEEVVARVMELAGVGRWTADWLLARGLGRPRAVAAGDLGVRKAVGRIYLGRDNPPDEREVREVAEGWGEAANWTAHLLLEALVSS